MSDFEEKVNSGGYKNPLPYGTPEERLAYRVRERELYAAFETDLRAWLLTMGVPQRYVEKVAAHAYDSGHSGGLQEVYIHALSLTDIFR